MIAVADTGFIIAVLNRRDNRHQSSSAVYRDADQIVLPQTALTEIAYLLNQRVGSDSVAKFLETLPESKVVVVSLDAQDLANTATILRRYADSRIDFVDATIMAVAERLNLTTICTLDRRDFSIYRPAHCPYFQLLPE
jgi:predicted nucleic acid-binding protein